MIRISQIAAFRQSLLLCQAVTIVIQCLLKSLIISPKWQMYHILQEAFLFLMLGMNLTLRLFKLRTAKVLYYFISLSVSRI